MHMAKAPNGPRAKFHVQSLDTMYVLSSRLPPLEPVSYMRATSQTVLTSAPLAQVRTQLPRQLPKGIPADPLLRRRLRGGASPASRARTPHTQLRCAPERAESKAVYRSRLGLYRSRRQDLGAPLRSERGERRGHGRGEECVACRDWSAYVLSIHPSIHTSSLCHVLDVLLLTIVVL